MHESEVLLEQKKIDLSYTDHLCVLGFDNAIVYFNTPVTIGYLVDKR